MTPSERSDRKGLFLQSCFHVIRMPDSTQNGSAQMTRHGVLNHGILFEPAIDIFLQIFLGDT
jgi:hypothetical protein